MKALETDSFPQILNWSCWSIKDLIFDLFFTRRQKRFEHIPQNTKALEWTSYFEANKQHKIGDEPCDLFE